MQRRACLRERAYTYTLTQNKRHTLELEHACSDKVDLKFSLFLCSLSLSLPAFTCCEHFDACTLKSKTFESQVQVKSLFPILTSDIVERFYLALELLQQNKQSISM